MCRVQVVVRDVRPWGNPAVDLVVRDGRIVELAPPRTARGDRVIEGGGLMALPSLTDAHAHPDKTFWGQPWLARGPATSLRELIEYDVVTRARSDVSVESRASAILRQAVVSGTRAMRAHVDVAPTHGLTNVVGVRDAAAALSSAIDVQVVAFPQLGVIVAPGTDSLLRDALDAGAHVVGGLDPWSLDGDADAQIDLLYAIAAEHGVEIDVHLHDLGAEGVRQVAVLAQRALSAGLVGRLTISHAFCLGQLPEAELVGVIDLLVRADVAIVTCALGADSLVPYSLLRREGVRVGLGSDGIRDPWTPFGNADMLERAYLAAYRTDARTDEELTEPLLIAVEGGADILGLPSSALRVGDPADLILVEGEGAAQVVIDRPQRRTVLKAGVVVAHDGQFIDSIEFSPTTAHH